MLLELIIVLLIGTLAGTFTGLIPGIHINLIGTFLVALFFSNEIFSSIPSVYLVVFIVSMAITHTFLDFIPSIFLGCPDTDTELSVLPGHQLLKKGHGHQAILLTTYGSLFAIFILLLIIPLGIISINKIYLFIENLIPFILIAVSIFLLTTEKYKITALIIFSLSGFLGLITLNLSSLKEPLLPLLTGLFGGSMLILSMKNNPKIPEQKIKKVHVSKRFSKPLFASLISAPFCSFLPGLGSGQAAIIGTTVMRIKNNEHFLILLGATNTLVMGVSFLTLYLLEKTRTGAAVAVQNIFPH